MGLAKDYNNVIESQLNVFAAWLPITNTYELGDYGIISDGVFAKMGNVKEFGVDFTVGTGNEAQIDFTSASTTVINFAAGAQVNVIPTGALDAKVTFKFQNAKSLLIKSPSINVSAIQNVEEIGNKLIASSNWQTKFKVVYQTYLAQDAVIMSTMDSDTEITFTGDATALQALNLGNASVGFSTTKKLGLSLQGKQGVIGLGLFQIVRGFLGLGKQRVAILSDDDNGEHYEVEHILSQDENGNPVEIEDDL